MCSTSEVGGCVLETVSMEETVQRFKLVINVAENGQSFEMDCQPSTSIELVQTCLASLAGVPPHDQLLICEDTRLEPQRSLAYYKLPADGRDVFLFNRIKLMADSPQPLPERVWIKEPVIPSPPSASLCGHPLDEASDPALRALPSYERQFRYHFQKGHAIFTASQEKFEASRRLLRETQVQRMALETAKNNMNHFLKMIDQMYGEFMKHFNRQHKQHADILVNFDRDLERLRACKLHPHLISANRTNLLDCVKAASVRKAAENCSISHKQFQGKVVQLKEVYLELHHSVQKLFYTLPSIDVHGLETMINEIVGVVDEEGSIMQSLSKDVDTVKKLVDDCVSSQLSASLRPHDAVSALGPMYDVHRKNHLPRMDACYQKLGKLLDFSSKKKHEMSICVHTCMQRVAALQSSIRDMRNQLSAFKEAMARQDEIFSELKLVRRVGPAYRACLAEVVRRKADMKLYMGQAGQLAEKMARKREAEVSRREEFLRVQSAFILWDILGSMGLFGGPSQCVVNIEPYDTDLLDIDMKDLERYAPESIVGPFIKGTTASLGSQGKSCLSASGSNSVHSSSEDSSVNMKENFEVEGVEDGNSDEISGTSKLEVENAWLKAELASAVALLCNIDPDFEDSVPGEVDESKVRETGGSAVQKTVAALALKDEYAKHLQNMLRGSQLQCSSYEKRIRELEQRLSDQYNELHKISLHGADGQCTMVVKDGGNGERETKPEVSVVTVEDRTGNLEHIDDGVSCAPPIDARQTCASDDASRCEHTGSLQEGGDESMTDFSGGLTTGDAAMVDSQREDIHELVAKEQTEEATGSEMQGALNLTSSQILGSTSRCFNVVRKEDKTLRAKETLDVLRKKDEEVASLQEALLHKTNQSMVAEEKLKAALEDIACLRIELEGNAEFLSECQINCAHLENRLHEAREEARTNQCSADRKAAEYNALRTCSVKLRGLVERLRHCVSTSQTGTAGFAESLRALAVSLGSNDTGDDGTADFRTCLRSLAERVGWLAQQRSELLERCTLAEANQSHLAAELESKTELLKSQYAKRKIDKQANKEKICFSRFEVHELAIFSPNAAGYYEAINRNCPNYFLSDESIALFLENLPIGHQYIIGQIVHIEKNVARVPPQSSPVSSSGRELSCSNTLSAGSRSRLNPYNLPAGTEYFVVTVAMVPDHLPSTVS